MTYREEGIDRSLAIVGISGTVLALNRVTGDIAWRVALMDDVDDDAFTPTPMGAVQLVLRGSRVLALGNPDVLYCIAHASGEVVWRAEVPAGTGARLVADHDRIFVTKGSRIACLDWNGDALWENPLEGLHGPIDMVLTSKR